jgi:hypothetical protein
VCPKLLTRGAQPQVGERETGNSSTENGCLNRSETKVGPKLFIWRVPHLWRSHRWVNEKPETPRQRTRANSERSKGGPETLDTRGAPSVAQPQVGERETGNSSTENGCPTLSEAKGGSAFIRAYGGLVTCGLLRQIASAVQHHAQRIPNNICGALNNVAQILRRLCFSLKNFRALCENLCVLCVFRFEARV